ncbi:hypothetical protein LXL04_026911 [Taraxacum kok-saghyz]
MTRFEDSDYKRWIWEMKTTVTAITKPISDDTKGIGLSAVPSWRDWTESSAFGQRRATWRTLPLTNGMERGNAAANAASGILHRLPYTARLPLPNFTYHSTIKSLSAANSPKNEKKKPTWRLVSYIASTNFTYYSFNS